MRIYISGPISGMPNGNKNAFAHAAIDLQSIGHVPVNPRENGLPDEAPWEAHMKMDVKLLVDCDGIAMLPGWEESRGATLEHNLARDLKIEIRTLENWLGN